MVVAAAPADIDEAVGCLARAFAQDPITGYLLDAGAGYPERLRQFFSLLMRARIALGMPVLVARGSDGLQGAAMGYMTTLPDWPTALAEEWDRFEAATDGMSGRSAVYEEISARGKPPAPHYYLGVLGVRPDLQGRGIGAQLLRAFCDLSAGDSRSGGVYLETAKASNVEFYRRAGFIETARGDLGSATLWCLYRPTR